MSRLRIAFFASIGAVAFACSSSGSDEPTPGTTGADAGTDATTTATDAATSGDGGATTDGATSEAGDGGCVLGPANCGACGVDCSNGACKNGICTLVDSNAIGGFYGPEAISIVGKNVYVAVAGQPTEIGRCATNGCAGTGPTPLLSFDGGGSEEPLGITVDEASGTIVWASYESGSTAGVHKLPIDGGASIHLNAGHPSTYSREVAIVGTNVVWGSDDSPGGALTCPLAGCPVGGPTVIGGLDSYARGLLVFGGDKIAIASQGALSICTGVACAGGPRVVADSQGLGIGAMAMAGDGKTLYWGASYPSKAIMYGRIDQDAGSGTTLVAQGQSPSSMLIVGDTLYWTLSGTDPNGPSPSFPLTVTSDGAVRKCKLPACSPVVDIAPGAAAPQGLATDGVAIYWVEVGVVGNLAGAGSVKKAPL